MGVYDTVEIGDAIGQVKCWGQTMHTYRRGDQVPDIEPGVHTYSVAMREGGYINIAWRKLMNWTTLPESDRVYDKYGTLFSEDSAGILGDRYRFRH